MFKIKTNNKRNGKTFMLLAAMLLMGQMAWAQPSGTTYQDTWHNQANPAGTSFTPLQPDENGYVHINTPLDLAKLMYAINAHGLFPNYNDMYVGKTIVLENDLDMSDYWWTPIGSTFTDDGGTVYQRPFRANFEGNGHTISGIYVDNSYDTQFGYYGGQYYGLFGYVLGDYTQDGTHYDDGCDFIRNFTLTNSHIKGGENTGGVIGFLYARTTVVNVICLAAVEGTNNVGGLIGQTNYIASTAGAGSDPDHANPTIKNCLQMGNSVTGTSIVGALIGWCQSDIVFNTNVYISNNYYTDDALDGKPGSKPEVNKQGYPIRKGESWPESVIITYPSNGLLYQNVFYTADSEGNPLTFSFHTVDLSTHITGVFLNGVQQGDHQGDYPVYVNPNNATEYVFTVTVINTDITGTGTEADPYIIHESDDWEIIASDVAEGTNYNGKYFKLASNLTSITVNTMMGTANNPFGGNFDGNGKILTFIKGSQEAPFAEDYCAPFRYVNGSTIQNLKIEGTIYTSGQYAASLVANGVGNVTISNCESSVAINSTLVGAGKHGGFVARFFISDELTFNGCKFKGRLVGANTTHWGGYVGESYTYESLVQPIIVNDCYFIPDQVNVTYTDCYTFAQRIVEQGNFYYYYNAGSTHLGTEPQGYPLLYAESSALDETKMYFNHNLVYGGDYDYYSQVDVNGVASTYYTDGGAVTITPTLTYGYNKEVTDYTIAFLNNDGQYISSITSPGNYTMEIYPPSGTSSPYVGQATDDFTVVGLTNGEGTSAIPFTINSAEEWNIFASVVNNGKNYSGKVVRLMANIAVTEMVGTNTATFNGTFDGYNNTLTFTKGTAESPFTENYCAPFHHIDGATIQDLVIEGTIHAQRYAAGLIGSAQGNWHVNGCLNRASINLQGSDCGFSGGFVAFVGNCGNEGPEFSNCIFNGQLLGNTARSNGGFIGNVGNSAGVMGLTDCLFVPTNVTLSTDDSKTFVKQESPHLTRCYYVTDWVQNQGVKASIYTEQPVGMGAETYSNELFTVYEYGFKLDNTYYSPIEPYVYTESDAYKSWYELANWTKGGAAATELPTINDNVIINGDAIILYEDSENNIYPAATAGYIIFGNDGTLTIEDGAQLIHSNEGVVATVKKTVEEWTEDPVGNWYFIASPMASSIGPANSYQTDIITNSDSDPDFDYDLYQLNPSSSMWENYKENEGNAASGFAIKNGKGYLYACNEYKVVEFTSELKPYSEADGNNQVDVVAGWNLVGNPFACNVYANQPFYKMNADGTAIEAVESYSTNAIAPCTGIIVNATGAGSVTFTKEAPQQNANQGGLNIAVTQQVSNRGTATNLQLDNAIVSFNEGAKLGKFYFGTQAANIYIPQGTEEYAIAFSNAQGEMPVNFKANQDGEYTLSINANDAEMSYLHLIDNMTGADIDLLHHNAVIAGEDPQSPAPSYTFYAKTTDYESRFKLVFATICEDTDGDNEAFAFVSDGNIIVNGTGTLQVIDMTGRVIRCADVARNVSTNGMTAGAYVLRLINGDDVRTQKIIIP